MAGSDKFITLNNGVQTLTTGIKNSVDAATSGNKLIATDSTGKLDTSFLPAGLGSETFTAVASEALNAGDFVNIYSNAGVRTARKADASNGRAAHAFVKNSFANAATVTAYPRGENTALTGITLGANYYLSATTPGGVTVTAPTNSGQIIQELGFGISATSIFFEYDSYIAIE